MIGQGGMLEISSLCGAIHTEAYRISYEQLSESKSCIQNSNRTLPKWNKAPNGKLNSLILLVILLLH